MQSPVESRKRPALNGFDISMVWGPDASDTLVDTRNGLLGALQFIPAGLPQQVRLPQDLLGFKIPDANRLLASVDVLPFDYGVLVRPWRHSDFDLRVCFGEVGKSALQEGTVKSPMVSINRIHYSFLNKERTYTMPRELPAQSQ